MKQGNITYKETPHFSNPYSKLEDTSSLQVDEAGNAKIKKNPERANVNFKSLERVMAQISRPSPVS